MTKKELKSKEFDVKKAQDIKNAQTGESQIHWSRFGPEFDIEDPLNITNCVAVLVIGGYLILLKENWDKWKLISTASV